MILMTRKTRFPALLKSPDGEIIAHGEGELLLEDRAINFTSDFVPLYPLGTPMQVVRLYKWDEVHRFSGKVYLSHKKLLRLVEVDDELLPGSENVCCGEMRLPVSLLFVDEAESKRPRKRALQPKPLPETWLPATVTGLTMHQVEVELSQREYYYEEPAFLLRPSPELPLPELRIRTERALLFGERPVYLCALPQLEGKKEQLLRAFLAHYNREHNKLF